MTVELSIAEHLMYSTVRIETYTASGNSTGTGFFYRMLKNGNAYVPVIVTNKHVVEGGEIGRMVFNIKENGKRVNNGSFAIEIPQFRKQWIDHPDPDVDLCVMPIAGIMEDVKRNHGVDLYFVTLDENIVPNETQIKGLDAIEEIVMVGYPNGLWDRVNNHPIIRRGITATHPAFDYNGQAQFLIDAAVFPGSSGSPVLIYNIGTYVGRDGEARLGNRVHLLGIIYAVHQYTAKGEIQVIEVPTKQQEIVNSNLPNNLGLVISAQKLRDFDDILRKFM
ncbi:trypsin-like peptidase domain-containing protein [Paenibacillus sp. PR3]|uniref:Trypsin-like peptidase domain-containing protein n=1 Tax=Paenibacillus terricola TaxID=2763503 RepID=A0ABR8N715_9BACL|nr:serine protease [Paenibacillus terricola]MBD3922980.1 trypsin-like peptidase domain-containing protein [Paenibacillus terricola]